MKTPEQMAIKAFTINDIRSWQPCYDPSRHLPENWTGTAVDILTHQSIPSQNKIWVVCREDVLDAKTLRLFAVWSARQVEHLMTDERSKNAIDVAERFANGNATQVELAAAWEAAEAAAWAAARDAARDVARAAARDVARDAARDAAEAAAGAAAREAAGDAACAAAWAAARAAARDAARDVAEAARAAAGAAQVAQLVKMLEEA